MDISLLYVALSRATSLKGLHIIGDFKPPKPRPATDPVVVEMDRMKKFCSLVPKYQWLRKVSEDTLQIISHNVQSIRKHHRSIRSDYVYMNSHLLLFQETWALANERYDFPEFSEVVRNDVSGRPSAGGTIIYAKNGQRTDQSYSISVQSGNEHVEITCCVKDDLKIVNIYKHPKTTLEFLRDTLQQNESLFESDNILVCGDFNQNMATESGIQRLLEGKYRMTMISPKLPTTNEFTTIDAVFGKLNSYVACVTIYESLFSFHKPIIIRVSKK